MPFSTLTVTFQLKQICRPKRCILFFKGQNQAILGYVGTLQLSSTHCETEHWRWTASRALFIVNMHSNHKGDKYVSPSSAGLTFAWHHGKLDAIHSGRAESVLQITADFAAAPSKMRRFVHVLRQNYYFPLSYYRLLPLLGCFPQPETTKRKENKREPEEEGISPLCELLTGWVTTWNVTVIVSQTACLRAV